MDTYLRPYIRNRLNAISTYDSLTGAQIENEIYKIALNKSNYSEDLNNETLFQDIYLQEYIKVFTNKDIFLNMIKNNDFSVTSLSSSREELSNIWSDIKNEKLEPTNNQAKKGMHRCPKCKSWYTDFQQLQTASADESMTVSVVCFDCGHRWKYS